VNRPRILLADDHRLLVERVAALLRPLFAVVGTAGTGEELVSAARRLEPDVIVSDIVMPVLTGIEAAHELRGAGLAAKFVFLSIHGESEFVDACLAEGAVGYVLKSRLKTDLIPAIRAALAGGTFISPVVSHSQS
jgi:DNA-binding NarL/FixJ family response regulator